MFETDVLDWKYKVKSKLVGPTSLENIPERLFNGCSLFSYLFMKTAMAIVYPNYDINKPKLTMMSKRKIELQAFICTSELLYGRHSIHIIRKLYDEATKANQNVTNPLRFYFEILPAESYNNIYNITYGKYQNTRLKDVEMSDVLDEVKVLLIRQIIEVAQLAVTVCIVFKLCNYFTYLLDQHVLTEIFIYCIGQANCTVKSSNACLGNIANQRTCKFHYKYDVFILSTENDNYFITENGIISCLEDRGYNVCMPERDFKAGISRFKLYSEAVENTNTIIVLCSKDFLEDPFMNKIVFGDFVLSISEDSKINDKNILLIKKGKCKIPTVLRRKYEYLDTTGMFPIKSCIGKHICAWVKERIFPVQLDNLKLVWFAVVGCLNIVAFVIATINFFSIKTKNISDSSLFATLMSYASRYITIWACFSLFSTILILRL